MGGVLRGVITAAFDPDKGRVRGEIEFSSDPDDGDEFLLDFAVRGETIEIVQGDTLLFSGSTDSAHRDDEDDDADDDGFGGRCDDVEVKLALFDTGVEPGARGYLEFEEESDGDCELELEIAVVGLSDGDYTVRVGGVDRGTLRVVAGMGHLEFESEDEDDDDDHDELELDFDPTGESIEIVRSDGAVVLERTLEL